MSNIHIRRTHQLGRQQARILAERMAVQLQERFCLAYRWEGDRLHFERSGVRGHMDIADDEICIRARLGLLLLPIKSKVESAIHRYVDELANPA